MTSAAKRLEAPFDARQHGVGAVCLGVHEDDRDHVAAQPAGEVRRANVRTHGIQQTFEDSAGGWLGRGDPSGQYDQTETQVEPLGALDFFLNPALERRHERRIGNRAILGQIRNRVQKPRTEGVHPAAQVSGCDSCRARRRPQRHPQSQVRSYLDILGHPFVVRAS